MEQILAELRKLNANVEKIAGLLKPRTTQEITFELQPTVNSEHIKCFLEACYQEKH